MSAEDARKGVPRIKVTKGIAALWDIKAAIEAGLLPDVYVHDGKLMYVTEISGLVEHYGEPNPIRAVAITGYRLSRLLAEHTFTYRVVRSGSNSTEIEVGPSITAIRAVLSASDWPGVPPLPPGIEIWNG